MHAHLIPGIDDGAKTVEKSIEYIEGLVKLGYQKLIATPHIMGEYYPNSPEIIQNGLEKLKKGLQQAGITIPVTAAAEYFLDDYFLDLLERKEPLLTLTDNLLLIEFSTFAPPANFQAILFQLTTMGYRPVLAHPERYIYYANNLNFFKEIKSKDCMLQVNLLSLTGHYGPQQKKLAHQLMQSKLIDFAGTDLHHNGHLEILAKGLKKQDLQKYLTSYPFLNNNL